MRYTILAFLIFSLCNTEGDSEPLVNFVSDIQRIREIARDFYEQIQTPVDRLQNLFREKFAPTLCKLSSANLTLHFTTDNAFHYFRVRYSKFVSIGIWSQALV